MTLIKYFGITATTLILFTGAFISGFMVGSQSKTVFHSHIISYLDAPSKKKPNITEIKNVPVTFSPNLPLRKFEVSRPISDDEFDCLSRTIYFEAGNQSYYGKIAVGSVVMNRVNDERYPDTICGVIKQHKQFSWYSDGNSDVPFDGPAWENSIQAAKEVLCGCDKASGLFDDASVQYYHADYVSPSWAKKMQRVAKIDNHIFYR
jgi:spore germination cell wall hydrolase CwlJ-like protein